MPCAVAAAAAGRHGSRARRAEVARNGGGGAGTGRTNLARNIPARGAGEGRVRLGGVLLWRHLSVRRGGSQIMRVRRRAARSGAGGERAWYDCSARASRGMCAGRSYTHSAPGRSAGGVDCLAPPSYTRAWHRAGRGRKQMGLEEMCQKGRMGILLPLPISWARRVGAPISSHPELCSFAPDEPSPSAGGSSSHLDHFWPTVTPPCASPWRFLLLLTLRPRLSDSRNSSLARPAALREPQSAHKGPWREPRS